MKSDRVETKELLKTRHLRWGWATLLLFLSLGIVLEGFHGFKARFYLDVAQSTRRLMWTLAHAHGTLLALVNIVFALTCASLGAAPGRDLLVASALLIVAAVLLPAGFFLGGVGFHGGDPSLGILLIPPGALALLVAVLLTGRAVFRKTR
jgi:hypothetical protein